MWSGNIKFVLLPVWRLLTMYIYLMICDLWIHITNLYSYTIIYTSMKIVYHINILNNITLQYDTDAYECKETSARI